MRRNKRIDRRVEDLERKKLFLLQPGVVEEEDGGGTAPSPSVTWESGTAYYDGTVALYVVYGADGDWQATKATVVSTLSTAANQTGTKPTTLAALQALSYS